MRGPATADRGVALVCFFPGAVVFSMLYSEGLLLALTAGCLLGLLRRRWVTAGALAALAGLTRFNGIVLSCPAPGRPSRPCAGGGSGVPWPPRRWRRSAPSPWSTSGCTTGAADAYFRTQREGWGQKVDVTGSLDALSAFVRKPFADPNVTVVVAALEFIVVGGLALFRTRPPAILVLYAAGCILVRPAHARNRPPPPVPAHGVPPRDRPRRCPSGDGGWRALGGGGHGLRCLGGAGPIVHDGGPLTP